MQASRPGSTGSAGGGIGSGRAVNNNTNQSNGRMGSGASQLTPSAQTMNNHHHMVPDGGGANNMHPSSFHAQMNNH